MKSEQVSSDTLSRLRAYAEQNAREPWIPVKAVELLALVECALAARPALTEIDWESDCHCSQCMTLHNLSVAIAKLEAL